MNTFIKLTKMARLLGCCLALGVGLAGQVQAAYPEKPITLIVAYAPGGGTDLTARAIATFMEKYLGNNARIIVLNRTGAGGAIGFAQLANAPADGYTIGMINTPNVITIPIERKSDFHWQRFDLLGNLVDDPGNFAVHAESPIKTLADLAAFAKARPGEVTVGTTGTGSDDHLAMLQFEKAAGVRMTHVPFKGSADVRTAVAGKQITVAAVNVGEAMQALKGGAPIRNLGSMSAARSSLAPDLPTFKEQGFNIELASLRGMAAPKGLPSDVRDALVKAIAQAVNDPEFKARAEQIYAPMRYLAPSAYADALKQAEAEFNALWKVTPWAEK
jgi:tripartite-type tricarboxylate transporter receptor subunit TctC